MQRFDLRGVQRRCAAGAVCRHFSSSLPSLSFTFVFSNVVRLAVADDLEPRRVEGPRVEEILLPVFRDVLLQIVERATIRS